MSSLIIYCIVAIVILYTEAKDCYVASRKFDLASELIFSFTWPLSLPLAVYTIWKEQK